MKPGPCMLRALVQQRTDNHPYASHKPWNRYQPLKRGQPCECSNRKLHNPVSAAMHEHIRNATTSMCTDKAKQWTPSQLPASQHGAYVATRTIHAQPQRKLRKNLRAPLLQRPRSCARLGAAAQAILSPRRLQGSSKLAQEFCTAPSTAAAVARKGVGAGAAAATWRYCTCGSFTPPAAGQQQVCAGDLH